MPLKSTQTFNSAVIAAAILCAFPKPVFGQRPAPQPSSIATAHPEHIIIISPLAGINRTTIKRPGTPFHPATQHSDTQPENALALNYLSSQVSLTTVLFMTDFHDSQIYGVSGILNLYTNNHQPFAWNIGGGYVWHQVDSPSHRITIRAPMVKFGFIRRWKPGKLALNPYIGLSREKTSTPRSAETSEAFLYGISCSFSWKTVHFDLKYYLEDQRHSANYYNNAHLRITVPVTKNLGITARLSSVEHKTIDQRSILIGPSFIF